MAENCAEGRVPKLLTTLNALLESLPMKKAIMVCQLGFVCIAYLPFPCALQAFIWEETQGLCQLINLTQQTKEPVVTVLAHKYAQPDFCCHFI